MRLRRSTRIHRHLLAVLTLVTTMQVAAEPDQAVPEFGYIDFPPFGYTDSEGHSRGYLVTLSRRIFEAMDQPVRFAQRPASRLYRQIDSGETAFTLGAANLHPLSETAVESNESTLTLAMALYYRDGTEPISDVSELRGERVVLMQGYSYGELGRFFKAESDRIHTTHARTHKSALRMIIHDRADYLLNYQTPADTVIAKNGLAGLKREVIGKIDVHFFASKTLDNARQITKQWDHHLRELKRNDQLPPMDYYSPDQ